MRVIGRMRATVGGPADRMAMAVTVPLQVVARTCDLSQFCHAMWRSCNPPGLLLRDDEKRPKFIRRADDTHPGRWEHAPCDPDRARQEARQAPPRARSPTDLPPQAWVGGHRSAVVRAGLGLPSSASWRARNRHAVPLRLTPRRAERVQGRAVAEAAVSGRMIDGTGDPPGRILTPLTATQGCESWSRT